MSVLALIPARSGSKGIPGKNWRTLGGETLVGLAYRCAVACAEQVVVSADYIPHDVQFSTPHGHWQDHWLRRPAELAQDDTPMIAVVQHALEQVPGPDDQIILLLQPTQPLRTVAHVQTAIARLRETQADSVVSVVELPLTHSPDVLCSLYHGQLWPYGENGWHTQPTRRQDVEPVYIRDGTAYCFWRRTVTRYGTIYGADVRPLIIPADETCELDTMEQWAALEARLAAR
jgi:CMP-N,N'-diacetyllegionaminic acid synthase